MGMLLRLLEPDEADLDTKIEEVVFFSSFCSNFLFSQMFSGAPINFTENRLFLQFLQFKVMSRSVLHTALRNFSGKPMLDEKGCTLFFLIPNVKFHQEKM